MLVRIKGMDFGMNTDFQKVFDLILDRAIAYNLKPGTRLHRLITRGNG